jgi:GT2 family glycosyltransferase
MPTGPTAQDYDENDKRIPVYTMPESTGLQEVGSIGTGIMLIKRRVFEGMSEPWFDMPWQTTRGYMGEDVFFCRKARELGFKVYIDHDVSHEIGHIGTFEFGHPHTWIVKEEMEKEAKNGT